MSPSLYRGEFQSAHRRSYLPGRNAADGGDRPHGRGAHRRSTTLLAQAVEHSGLKAADRSTTRHLRLDLGADEDQAGPRAAQSIRSGRAMIVDHSVLLELNPRDRSDFTEFCMPIV